MLTIIGRIFFISLCKRYSFNVKINNISVIIFRIEYYVRKRKFLIYFFVLLVLRSLVYSISWCCIYCKNRFKNFFSSPFTEFHQNNHLLKNFLSKMVILICLSPIKFPSVYFLWQKSYFCRKKSANFQFRVVFLTVFCHTCFHCCNVGSNCY